MKPYIRETLGVILLLLFGSLLCYGAVVTIGSHTNGMIIETSRVQPSTHTWTKTDSLAHAHDQVIKNAEAQFTCLSNLWGKESAWEPKAHNPIKVMGKTAGGIPQLLGMSPSTPPTEQIERGLSYIYFRYGTICLAWKHFQRYSWY